MCTNTLVSANGACAPTEFFHSHVKEKDLQHLSTKEDGDKIINKLLEGDTEKSDDSETLFDNANIKNNVGNEATFFH